MSNPTYANIFNILKPIEAMTERKSGYFSFSASGKDQNLAFRLQFSGNDRGMIKYELLEEGERMTLNHMVNGRPNCIIDKDVTAIAEQMAVLEVSKGVTDVIVAIVEGLRRMEVVAPVFALNRAVDTKNTNRAEYVFGIAAYLLDDQYQPVGRISLSITVFKMSQVERTAMLIRKANEERDMEEAGVARDVVVTDGGNERYKITAMIQPGSPAMEQLMAKEQASNALGELADVINNELPLNNVHGMKDDSDDWANVGSAKVIKANVPDEAEPYTLGNESVCIDPELIAILDAKAPKFNLASGDIGADNLSALAEYAEQTKRLHITPDPTAELGCTATLQNGDKGVIDKGYKLTDMHGDRGVVVPVSED